MGGVSNYSNTTKQEVSHASSELVRIERLTNALNVIAKIDNLLDTFISCMDEMKRIMGRNIIV